MHCHKRQMRRHTRPATRTILPPTTPQQSTPPLRRSSHPPFALSQFPMRPHRCPSSRTRHSCKSCSFCSPCCTVRPIGIRTKKTAALVKETQFPAAPRGVHRGRLLCLCTQPPSFAGPAAAENVAQCHVGIAPYEMPNADFIYCWQKYKKCLLSKRPHRQSATPIPPLQARQFHRTKIMKIISICF